MGEVHQINGGYYASISTLARCFGKGRDTTSRLLARAGVVPTERLKGAALYDWAEGTKAVLGVGSFGSFGGDGDDSGPEKLPPQDRLAYFKSENERLKSAITKAEVVLAEDHEAAISSVLKIVVQDYSVVADQAERELGLDTKTVALMCNFFAARREEFYEKLMALADE